MEGLLKALLPTGITTTTIILSLFFLLRYIIKNPEIIDKWSNLYYKYLGFLEKDRNKKLISSEIDYRITKIAKDFNKESDGIMPFGLRINWIKDDSYNKEATIQNNEIVLVLKEEQNSDKNLVDAFLLFTPKALLPKSRNSCDTKLLHTFDIYTIKKLLGTGRYTSAYNYFLQQVVGEEIKTGELNKDDLDTLQISDDKGFYSRILLEEFKELGESVYNTIDEKQFIEETIAYFNFIREIVNRKKGDDSTKLLFRGKRIKLGIVFVAKHEKLLRYGVDPYLFRIKKDFELGANKVYILGHSIIEEESQMDEDGYVISVKRKYSFEYLDLIEDKLKSNDNYNICVSEKFMVTLDNFKKMTKLMKVEKKDFSIDAI